MPPAWPRQSPWKIHTTCARSAHWARHSRRRRFESALLRRLFQQTTEKSRPVRCHRREPPPTCGLCRSELPSLQSAPLSALYQSPKTSPVPTSAQWPDAWPARAPMRARAHPCRYVPPWRAARRSRRYPPAAIAGSARWAGARPRAARRYRGGPQASSRAACTRYRSIRTSAQIQSRKTASRAFR